MGNCRNIEVDTLEKLHRKEMGKNAHIEKVSSKKTE
jgi:hypothetical protein